MYNLGETEGQRIGQPLIPTRATHYLPERVDRVLSALVESGSTVLLLGEPGSGRTRLAEAAARALEEYLGEEVAVTVMAPPPNPASGVAPVFGYQFPELFGPPGATETGEGFELGEPMVLAQRLIEVIERAAGERSPVLVVPSVDEYTAISGYLLDALVRSRRVRIVATARHLTGAAGRITRDPRVRKLAVEPLNYQQSERCIASLLGGEHVEKVTLRRWYAATRGNEYYLTVLALTMQQRGLVKQKHGMIWELPGAEAIPEEFFDFVRSACSESQLTTLQRIALGEPMSEAALLRHLDAEDLSKLQDLGLVVGRSRQGGEVALMLSSPLLTAAVKSQVAPAQKIEICEELFNILDEDRGLHNPVHLPERLIRLVVLGLEAGRDLEFDWLWAAFEILVRGRQHGLTLNIALAIAAHGEADPEHIGIAAMRASRAARLLGDRTALRVAMEHIRSVIWPDGSSAPRVSETLRVSLQLEWVDHLTLDRQQYSEAFNVIENLEREYSTVDGAVAEKVRSGRVTFLARTGKVRQAFEQTPDDDSRDDITVEWGRAPARAISSLVLQQRGRFSDAICVAEDAYALALLGERPQEHLAELLGFCWFVGNWAGGSLESARSLLTNLEDRAISNLHHTGLVETGTILLALSDARWREAAQHAARVQERLTLHDSLGLLPLVHAALALALAALGERDAANKSIRAAETPIPGLSQALAGTRRSLLLQARQWNGSEGIVERADQLANWAAGEQLDFIELQALYAWVIAEPSAARVLLPRVKVLAAAVDAPMGSAYLAHIKEIEKGVSAWESPAARMLAELGVWMPLPQTPQLSSREREIALLASFGYSSRWIAEQFHLSVRTVETHLRHVFTKLGTANRDELRRWFRDERLTE